MRVRSSMLVPGCRALMTTGALLSCMVFLACADDDAPASPASATLGKGTGGGAGAAGAAGSGTTAGGSPANAGAGGTTPSAGAGGTPSAGAGGADDGTAGSAQGISGSSQGEGGSNQGSSGAGGTSAGGSSGSSAGSGGSSAGASGIGGSAGSGNVGACGTTGKTGYALGDVLGPLPVRDCLTGELTTLDEVCSASATWVFAAHTHCPTCKATAGFTDEIAKAVADQNVAIVHTVYDDNGTSCETWKKTYGLASYANVRVFADPGGAVFDKVKSQSYTAPSLFLRADRTITHKEHGMSKAAVLAQIGNDLAP